VRSFGYRLYIDEDGLPEVWGDKMEFPHIDVVCISRIWPYNETYLCVHCKSHTGSVILRHIPEATCVINADDGKVIRFPIEYFSYVAKKINVIKKGERRDYWIPKC
jgi:hypothetical protein